MPETLPPFYLLSGPPGAGKSSLIAALAPHVSTVPEPARRVLARERASGGTATGEQDAAAFVEKMQMQAEQDYRTAKGLTLFDRGLPDLRAYASYYDVSVAALREAIRTYRYQTEVFWCPAWAEIYQTDAERTLDFASAEAFGARVRLAYESAGYVLIEVPLGPIDARAAFIRARFSL